MSTILGSDGVMPAALEQPGIATTVAAENPMPVHVGRGLWDRDWQKALVIMLTLLVGLALIWVVWQAISPLLHTIVLFIVGGLLAFALSGPVDALTRRLGRRVFAIIAVYLLLAALVLGGVALLTDPLARQAAGFAETLPQYANELTEHAPDVRSAFARYGIRTDVDQLLARGASTMERSATEVLNSLVGTLAGVGGIVVDVGMAVVISLYLVADGPSFLVRGLRLLPPRDRALAKLIAKNVEQVFGNYLRSQLTLASIIAVGATVGMDALGLPYPLVLGVLAGLLDLVPMFGSTLSAVPALVVALSMPFPTVLWVLLFFIVLQQIESNVLAPRLSGRAVGLHPLAAMFALLAGVQLAGLLGGLLAVPLAGLLWALLRGSLVHGTD